MAETNEQTQTQDDPLKNIKAEFDRKYGNLEAGMKQLIEANKALTSQLSGLKPAPESRQESAEDNWEEMLTYKPAEAVRKIKDNAVRESEQVFRKVLNEQTSQQRAAASLLAEFPELSNAGEELTKETARILEGYSDEDRQNTAVVRSVAFEAAAKLGVKPVSVRRKEGEDSDSYTGSGSNRVTRRTSRTEEEIDPLTIEAARAFGRDVDDPKYMENLKKHSKRNFRKYT